MRRAVTHTGAHVPAVPRARHRSVPRHVDPRYWPPARVTNALQGIEPGSTATTGPLSARGIRHQYPDDGLPFGTGRSGPAHSERARSRATRADDPTGDNRRSIRMRRQSGYCASSERIEAGRPCAPGLADPAGDDEIRVPLSGALPVECTMSGPFIRRSHQNIRMPATIGAIGARRIWLRHGAMSTRRG